MESIPWMLLNLRELFLMRRNRFAFFIEDDEPCRRGTLRSDLDERNLLHLIDCSYEFHFGELG